MGVTDDLLGIIPPVIAAGVVTNLTSNLLDRKGNDDQKVVFWIVTSKKVFIGPFDSSDSAAMNKKNMGKSTIIYPTTERNAKKAKIEYNQLQD